MIPYHWLGPDAEGAWGEYLDACEADAEAMRHLEEADDE